MVEIFNKFVEQHKLSYGVKGSFMNEDVEIFFEIKRARSVRENHLQSKDELLFFLTPAGSTQYKAIPMRWEAISTTILRRTPGPARKQKKSASRTLAGNKGF